MVVVVVALVKGQFPDGRYGTSPHMHKPGYQRVDARTGPLFYHLIAPPFQDTRCACVVQQMGNLCCAPPLRYRRHRDDGIYNGDL